jgi:hypothetical protein
VSQFHRGARIASKDSDADEASAIDASSFIDRGMVFSNPKSRDSDPDFLGKATVNGRPYNIRGHWRSTRTGRRIIDLRFFPLREPPPRERPV